MEEMTRKQPDVDKVTKTHKRKATADPPVQSQIPVLEKGRTCRRFCHKSLNYVYVVFSTKYKPCVYVNLSDNQEKDPRPNPCIQQQSRLQ